MFCWNLWTSITSELYNSDFCIACQVFQCEHDDCARFYHPKCVAQMLYPDSHHSQELFELQVAARERFSCPMHECIVCMEVENKNDKSMQFAVCRRCPTVYHRKCLPRSVSHDIHILGDVFRRLFPNSSYTFFAVISFSNRRRVPRVPCEGRGRTCFRVEFWYSACMLISIPSSLICLITLLLPLPLFCPAALLNFVNLFYRKHEIVRKLQTPARNHIIFPEANVLKTFQAAPMEQDMPDQKEAPDHSLPVQIHSPPPPAASDQNQCCCSSPFDSFAPSSLFMHPHPGSCGWLDDWPSRLLWLARWLIIQPICPL